MRTLGIALITATALWLFASPLLSQETVEKQEPKLVVSELITPWGEEVTPENAWTEYPRPQMARDRWQNLNGEWDYAITSVQDRKTPQQWDGKILVPFCLESKLGGVQRLLDASESLWYRRAFEATKKADERTLLNFEAVDYRCEVFVNGQSVGTHQGGNTPFTFDITDAIRDGRNELVVRIEDETEGWQLRGKQVLEARGIWYTRVSGIWQTVWFEQVAPRHVEDLKITTDAAAGTITVWPTIAGGDGSDVVRVIVRDGDQVVAERKGSMRSFTLEVPGAKLWSP
ncbi:MAG: sugar-binding domain-containing protein, partial [Planctomycetota bacterium]